MIGKPAIGAAATMAGAMLAAATAQAEPFRYIPSVSNPLFNESPLVTTEIRPIYIHHDIPTSFLTGGGNIDIGAVQARLALTDRLAIIATKDGYADIHFAGVLPDEHGFANIAAGVKYAVVLNEQSGTAVTVGLRYEAPVGSLKTAGINLQGHGDGFVNVFVTALQQVDRFQIQASVNADIALDSNADSSLFVGSIHANYAVTDWFFPLVEFNVFSVIGHGNRLPVPFEGFDVVNFGATGGGTVATVAAGARFRVAHNVLLGAAYEAPVTSRKDITSWRVYADAVITF
ncbi:MAG: hypothetical protein GC201_12050 [Alphaproteobacteria bacterium]|nr:hypothetical protein [Alphaproteobacteria bacterium]